MKQPLLKIKNVKKIYQMDGIQVNALRGVTLQINKGDMVTLMGPSGSGKSTLMHIIGCLDKPTSGKVYFKGQDILKLTDDQLAEIRNKQIGFIFQTFNLLPRTTALSNVKMPLIYADFSESQMKQMAQKKLVQVGLGDRLDHHSNQLSGGQQQRVAIARALINNPDMILADEPTGNLDTKSGQEILKLLKNLNKMGNTIVIVTHDPEIAAQTKKVYKIKDGQLI